MARPSNEQAALKRRELNEKQMAFAVWSATIPVDRVPETRDGLAEVLGVSRQTLWRWERDPRVTEAVRFLVLQNAGSPDRVGSILDMLHEEALAQRSGRLAEVWLKATGVMSQFQRNSTLLEFVEQENAEFTDFSLEELELLRAQASAAGDEDVSISKARSLLNGGKVS
jgi:transcriptional regulator with XRE-family HTH domain